MGTDSKTPQSPPESSRLLKLVVVGHGMRPAHLTALILIEKLTPSQNVLERPALL